MAFRPRTSAAAPGFWQKDIPATAPTWLTRWHETGVDAREDRDANDHLIADRAATLCWLGNQASFEIHAWTGRLPEAWQPTFAYIDIDPGDATTWEETLILARLYRTALGHLGRPLATDRSMLASYLLMLTAVALRLAAIAPSVFSQAALHLSAAAWIAALALYLWRFAPLLIRPRS